MVVVEVVLLEVEGSVEAPQEAEEEEEVQLVEVAGEVAVLPEEVVEPVAAERGVNPGVEPKSFLNPTDTQGCLSQRARTTCL